MNAKEGFHNVLTYRGFLMFFLFKNISVCCANTEVLDPYGGLEQYVNAVTVVII